MFPTPNQYREQNGMEPICGFCRGPIRMMVMKGTGFCSANCKDNYEKENNNAGSS